MQRKRFLALLGLAAAAPTAFTEAFGATMADPLRIFPDVFVPNIQAAPYHSKWKQQASGDNHRWEAYRDACIAYKKGQPAPAVPAMATKYGNALVAAGTEHVSVVDLGTVWPTQTATKTLNQFTDFTIAWNKFTTFQVDPSATAPPYTPWPSGGGIFAETTPFGPGFHLLVTPEMLYQSIQPPDSKMARLSWGTAVNAPLGFANKNQRWEWYWMFPASENVNGFPSTGLGPGELVLCRTDDGTVPSSDGFGWVGHGFNLAFTPLNPSLRFQFFRTTGSNNFVWTWGPPLVLDQWHHFMWEIRWSAAADGFIRVYTDDMTTPWVNYSGPTIISNQQTWGVFCSLRNDEDRTNGIHYGNMTITDF